MPAENLYQQRTTLISVVTSLSILAIGILLLWIAHGPLQQHLTMQAIIRQLGSLLIASTAINIIWQLSGKRVFLDEIMSMARVAEDVRVAGITTVTRDFQRGIDWPALLDSANKLDIFFAYGRTWRGANDAKLQALARRPKARVRIVLPDPYDQLVAAELARRFGKTVEDLKREIESAKEDFIRIFGPPNQVELSIWYLPFVPVYSFYRFDQCAVLSLYKYKGGRGDVPTFLVEQGGALFQFIQDELYAFIGEADTKGLAVCVYPEPQIGGAP